jgi:hypothetical protein
MAAPEGLRVGLLDELISRHCLSQESAASVRWIKLAEAATTGLRRRFSEDTSWEDPAKSTGLPRIDTHFSR